ncbi:hypothetical protein [Stappia sp. ICDLI1TA098]
MHDDGTWSAPPQIPVEVNWIVIDGEYESCNTSVDGLIRDSELEPGTCDMHWFIQGETRLRFEPDGLAPHFVPVETLGQPAISEHGEAET